MSAKLITAARKKALEDLRREIKAAAENPEDRVHKVILDGPIMELAYDIRGILLNDILDLRFAARGFQAVEGPLCTIHTGEVGNDNSSPLLKIRVVPRTGPNIMGKYGLCFYVNVDDNTFCVGVACWTPENDGFPLYPIMVPQDLQGLVHYGTSISFNPRWGGIDIQNPDTPLSELTKETLSDRVQRLIPVFYALYGALLQKTVTPYACER